MKPAATAKPRPNQGPSNRASIPLPGANQRAVFTLPVVLTAFFLGIVFLPPARTNARLLWSILSTGAALIFWQCILFLYTARRGQPLRLEFVAVKSHYVQASVQFCVYAYWGWYWRKVYVEAPLILAQVLFLYVFDGLLSWSRGRTWRLGFGPLPIIFSTNLFMWFKEDWFFFQFLMIATGALGKEFIRWNRDGRRTHIFNPSALGLTLFSLGLLWTGTTRITWGEELATTLGAPYYIYLEIFLVGLIVQFFFSVTLMTLAATAALCLLNLAYTASTGVYFFVDSNIPIAVFLGLHLLVTDPSTSPRSNLGKVIFGGLYGVGVWVAYAVLVRLGAPSFYDKLLVVPLLNLSVKLIDRLVTSGLAGRLNRWESSFKPRAVNLAYMTCWTALFVAMLSTGFVEAAHPGSNIAFWKKASEEGRPRARENLILMLQDAAARGSGEACNELGLVYTEGKVAAKDPRIAARWFGKACQLGFSGGCANLAIQSLFSGVPGSEEDLAQALNQLELECAKGTNGQSFYLVGLAYETGRGRPVDKQKARVLYFRGYELGELGACKNLARMQLSGDGGPMDHAGAAQSLEKASEARDALSCQYLAFMYHQGDGVPRDEKRALALLKKACELGSAQACAALKSMQAKP